MVPPKAVTNLPQCALQTHPSLVSLESDLCITRYQVHSIADQVTPISARLLKHLAAMDTIHEVKAEHYTHTPFSQALATVNYSDTVKFMSVFQVQADS